METAKHKIPNYIVELLARSRYNYDTNLLKVPFYATGYTITVKKRSPYQHISTFTKEIVRFRDCMNRRFRKVYHGTGPVCYILEIPEKTHYTAQAAVVTVFDPVMKDIEKHIAKKEIRC